MIVGFAVQLHTGTNARDFIIKSSSWRRFLVTVVPKVEVWCIGMSVRRMAEELESKTTFEASMASSMMRGPDIRHDSLYTIYIYTHRVSMAAHVEELGSRLLLGHAVASKTRMVGAHLRRKARINFEAFPKPTKFKQDPN